jgi:hypothetical protein
MRAFHGRLGQSLVGDTFSQEDFGVKAQVTELSTDEGVALMS